MATITPEIMPHHTDDITSYCRVLVAVIIYVLYILYIYIKVKRVMREKSLSLFGKI